MEPMPLSFTGLIHYPRLKDRLATHFVPFAEFEKDAAAGELPDFSLIEPDMTRRPRRLPPGVRPVVLGHGVDIDSVDPPSSILGGEAFLARVYDAYRSATSSAGANVWNTALLIGWDEPGGTYDHVPPGAGPAARPGRARRASSASRSTVPATGFPPSSSRPGSSRARCTTRSTATPR